MMENNDVVLNAVLYTDGSADNILKIYGYGAHGYIFDANDESGKTSNKPNNYLVTNVGYLEPGKVKIVDHKIINPICYVDMYGYSVEPGTNNIGEVVAIIDACYRMIEKGVKNILIYTDSKYAMGVLEKSFTYPEEKIEKEIEANKILYFTAKKMYEEMVSKDMTIKIDKIKAHEGHIGNEAADDLALLGRLESTRKIGTESHYNESLPSGYWKPKYERHTFLNTKQIFFTPNEVKREDGGMEYYILNYKNENEIGKRQHTAAYGYVILKEKDPHIEAAKEMYKATMNGHSVPSTVRMDNLFRADTFRYYEMFGPRTLTTQLGRKNKNLTVLENEVVVNPIDPPALAYKAFDDMVSLKMIVSDYMNMKNNPDEHKSYREFININDLIYTTNDKGKLIIKPELINDSKPLIYNYKKDGAEAKIVIQLGTDIITRNQLKRLEKQEPNVYLVVQNSKNIKLNYFTLIDLETKGDLSVWANYYSNTVMFK